jgi:hypothetical protein
MASKSAFTWVVIMVRSLLAILDFFATRDSFAENTARRCQLMTTIDQYSIDSAS